MSEDDVRRFLRCPYGQLVELALTIANLTWKERAAIDLCARQGYTQEEAAERAGYSVDAMQRWYRAGMRKLSDAWAGSAWIMKVIG